MNIEHTDRTEQRSYVPKLLEKWTRPQHYYGATWENYYAAPCSRTRDSDHIDASNWDVQLKELGGESEDGESVVVVRENHFLVGWVEWLAIREDAYDALRIADRIASELEGYPILDEDDVGMREWEAEVEQLEERKWREEDNAEEGDEE